MFSTESFKIILSYLILVNVLWSVECCEECGKQPYVAPGNMKYPYGDETQMDADLNDIGVNTIICKEPVVKSTIYGRCPYPPPDPNTSPQTNPHVFCPFFKTTPGSSGALPLGEPDQPVDVMCKSCDLKKTQDESAVIMKCSGCYDVPIMGRIADLSGKDLLYTVYYVGLANYTTVSVNGTENIN